MEKRKPGASGEAQSYEALSRTVEILSAGLEQSRLGIADLAREMRDGQAAMDRIEAERRQFRETTAARLASIEQGLASLAPSLQQLLLAVCQLAGYRAETQRHRWTLWAGLATLLLGSGGLLYTLAARFWPSAN